MMGWPAEFLAVAVVCLLTFAAWTDVAARIIPDWVSIVLAVAGLAARMFAGLPSAAVSIGLALLLFVLLALAHARGILGGGDVKLAAATAIGLPADAILRFLVATSL